jgi:hypothetical protein
MIAREAGREEHRVECAEGRWGTARWEGLCPGMCLFVVLEDCGVLGGRLDAGHGAIYRC